MTLVHVYRETADSGTLTPVSDPDDPIDAANPRQAVRKATDGMDADDRSGRFVVIADRSMRVLERKVETQEIDRWA